ncbi:MAG: M1 family metallopeptidase [Myxococcales bacterium]|nr:M1 family metallopeptidase [Myxococcales bacterium]
MHVLITPFSMGDTGGAKRDVLEAVGLLCLGVLGIVAGVRSFAPTAVVAKPAPVVNPPPQGWPAMPSQADRVVRYVLSAKLDPDQHTIDGKGTMVLRNVANVALDRVRLHLYLNAFKNDRTVFRRARVGGFRGDHAGAPGFCDVKSLVFEGKDLWPARKYVGHAGESPQDSIDPRPEGTPDDETDVEVPLPHPIKPGESVEFAVEFHDALPEVSERTGYHGSFHFAGQWFPKFAKLEENGAWASFPFHHVAEFYADYGQYDVTIDVPERFVVGASGALASSRVEAGRRVVRHTLDDVHDFAWTAWDKFSEKTGSFVEGGAHVAIRLLYPPGYDEPAQRSLESAIHGLRDKGARFGAYPYPVLTIVHPPSGADEAGGMEYPTLITTGGSGLPNHGLHEVEGVTVHELGHQWFYGLVGTHEVEWPAGDEGLNSLADELALGTLFPGGSAVSLGPLQIGEDLFHRRGANPPFEEPIFQPAWAFASGRSYGARIYGATAMAMVSVRNACGAEAFDTALGVYTRAQRFRHPKPSDLLDTLSTHLGTSCGEAARLALTTPTTLDYYVEQLQSERRTAPAGWFDGPSGRVKLESGKLEAGYRSSVWIGRRGVVDLPVDVELRFADGSRSRRVVRFVRSPAIVDTPRPTSRSPCRGCASTPTDRPSSWAR